MGGVVAAVAAAVCFALFQTVQRRALRSVGVGPATAAVLVVAAAVLATTTVLGGGLARIATAPIDALAASAAAGLLHFGLGWTLLGVSQVRLGAARTGLLVGTVPLLGAIVAAVALDEPLGLVDGVGLAATVAGVVVVVTRPARGRAPAAAGAGGVDRLGAGGVDRLGVVAGLLTAVCWSLSPVLIRRGVEGVGSSLAAAAVGMVVCAVVYGGVLLAMRGAAVVRATVPTRWLLTASGAMVGTAILLQWTAYGLVRVATVLALLQLTPPLVVGLSARIAGDVLEAGSRARVWAGTALTVAGSLVLVLVR